jgi:hypothetical protein
MTSETSKPSKTLKPSKSDVIKACDVVTLPDEYGNKVTLTPNQLEMIQHWIAESYERETIAVMMALDVDAFVQACDDGKLKGVARRGYILDRQEFKNNYKKSLSKARDYQIYGQDFHGLAKSPIDAGKSAQIIVINTGIQGQIPWQSNT